MKKNIAFIDSRVEGYESIVANLDADTQWFLLKDDQDGISQIKNALSGDNALDAISLFSHGSAGTLYLGSTVLDQTNIDVYTDQLRTIGESLSDYGDILLYGCNVAQGDEGQVFIRRLADLTGADVAASDNTTGNAALGGDWKLEAQTGPISYPLDNIVQRLDDYPGVLFTDDHSNEKSGATLLTLGTAANGSIQYTNDVDYFKINVEAGQTYVFKLLADSGNGTLKKSAWIWVYGVDDDNSSFSWHPLIGGDNTYQDGIATVKYTPGSSGVSYLEVDPSQDDLGTYKVLVDTFGTNNNKTNRPPTGRVWITGATIQGSTLYAQNDVADADGLGPITYTWLSNYTVLGTGKTYKPIQADVGTQLMVTANYTDGSGFNESVTSQPTDPIIDSNDAPIVNHEIGDQSTNEANPFVFTIPDDSFIDVDPNDVLSYSTAVVDSSGNRIGGLPAWLTFNDANHSLSGTPTAKDIGNINIKVTATDKAGRSVSDVFVLSVLHTNKQSTGSVIITGNPIQGQTLIASNTLSDADGLGTISYQWLRGSDPIIGGNASVYKLTQADVGSAIAVKASYTDGFGTLESKTSSQTTLIANVNDRPTGSISITGEPKQGGILTTSNAFSDADGIGVINYQWMRDGQSISGATGEVYQVTQQDAGHGISAQAMYTDGFGAPETIISDSVFVIPLVTVTEQAVKGTLSGSTGTDVFDGTNSIAIVLAGGKGDDSYIVDNTNAKIKESTNQGTDTVYSSAVFTLPNNLEKLILTGTNNIDGKGNNSNNSLVGNAGNNTLSGLGGNDTLTGGSGSDRFVFDSAPNAKKNIDTITDFTPGKDTIALSAKIFKMLGPSVDTSDIWLKDSGNAQGQSEFLVYDSATGTLAYDADGSGKKAAITIALIGIDQDIHASDFVII